MPSTPNFGITYPCEGSPIAVTDFSSFALSAEAAISTVSAEGAAVVADPVFHAIGVAAIAASGADTTMTYTGFVSSFKSSGFTVNTATGDITAVTTGIYELWALVNTSGQATVSMTSQRIGIFINGTFYASQKRRAYNPAIANATYGTFSVMAQLTAGDVVNFKYQWTGTAALSSQGGGTVGINFVANV